jgi:hypothetical protein
MSDLIIAKKIHSLISDLENKEINDSLNPYLKRILIALKSEVPERKKSSTHRINLDQSTASKNE